MLYTAQHLSLACVEMLVHLDKSQVPIGYVWSGTELPLNPGFLRFESLSHVAACQGAGRMWIEAGQELAIQVPSVVVPEEFNILLNPKHGEYRGIVWSEPKPFRFDPRLFLSEPQVL